MILDLEWVPDKGGEAKVAMGCFQRLHPLVPGAQGVIYDTALRGTHHQVLLREMGLMPVNRITATVAGSNRPRRAEGRRVEKAFTSRTARSSCRMAACGRFGSTHGAGPSGWAS